MQTSLKTNGMISQIVRIKHLSGLFNPINLAEHDATNLVVFFKFIMDLQIIFYQKLVMNNLAQSAACLLFFGCRDTAFT